MDSNVLAMQFAIGAFVLERNIADVTHTESVKMPQPGGNTMNWIVGHVVRTRNQAIALLGGNPPFNDAEFACYGTEPFEPRRALPIDELKRRFDLLGLDLDQALKKVTPEQLTHAAPFSPTGNANETVGSLLVSIAFHESYHLGQTGLSRRLLGKAGALLAPGEKGHQ